jgi:signal transduction histidine kinase
MTYKNKHLNLKKLWHDISYLGLRDQTDKLYQRRIILNNQLNCLVIVLCLFMLLYLRISGAINNESATWGSIRVIILLFTTFINLILAKYRFFKASILSLILLPSFILMVMPAFFHFVENESFIYYPYGAIALSILPQLLLEPYKNKYIYLITIAYYFIMMLFMEPFLHHFLTKEIEIWKYIRPFYTYNKLVQIIIFFFLHIGIFYLKNLNRQFEARLNQKTEKLDQQNEELYSLVEQLKNVQQQLIQSEKMAAIGTLISGIAHEINNPLNYIQGGTCIIEETCEKDQAAVEEKIETVKKATSMIHKGIDKAGHIIKALMAFSRHGDINPEKKPIEPIIDNTLLFLNSKMNDNLDIEKHYNFNRPITQYPEKSHQILINILDNAIYYANCSTKPQQQKKVIISTEATKDSGIIYCTIKIYNTGMQIPQDNINKIFNPFFTTKDTGQSSGMGLSIAFSLIQEHNGLLEVHNTDNGVCFIIKYPAE